MKVEIIANSCGSDWNWCIGEVVEVSGVVIIDGDVYYELQIGDSCEVWSMDEVRIVSS